MNKQNQPTKKEQLFPLPVESKVNLKVLEEGHPLFQIFFGKKQPEMSQRELTAQNARILPKKGTWHKNILHRTKNCSNKKN